MTTFVQFNHYNIRDAVTHPPQKPLASMRGHKSVVWCIENGHNQPVTVQLIGNVNRGSSGATVFGNALVVSANTRENLAITVDQFPNPFFGTQVIFETAPTGGDLTIKGRTVD